MATERSEIPAAGSGNPYLPIPIDEARDALAGEVRLLADCGVDDETLYWSAPDPSTLLGPPDALECVRDRMEGWTMFDAGLRIAFRPSRIVSETFEGTIDVRGISQRMRLKDLKECYEVALREDPELRGRALVGFVIEADGRVSLARVAGFVLPARGSDCILDLLLAIQFDPPGEPQGVEVPMQFNPVKPDPEEPKNP